jgi:mannitol-1-/sugar-/sorbitol-6-phosphatase
VRRVSAVLFDVDGVLLYSRESTERGWLEWARRRGVDPELLRGSMHGVRSADVIAAVAPELDAAAEADLVERIQEEDTDGVRPVPGAAEALAALDPDRTAAVTSATRALATARLAAAGIEPPRVILYAGDVGRGKPDPEGYLAAAERLGVDPAEALVVEDAPQGLEAGRAAGAATVGVTTTHAPPELAAADFVIDTLEPLPGLLRDRFEASGVLWQD